LDIRILRLIATVIEVCEPPREHGAGHPLAETVRVLRTLRLCRAEQNQATGAVEI